MPGDAREPARGGAAPDGRRRDALPVHLVLGFDGRDPDVRRRRRRAGALLPRGPGLSARTGADRHALRSVGAIAGVNRPWAPDRPVAAPRSPPAARAFLRRRT